jgi:hypothetical protein
LWRVCLSPPKYQRSSNISPQLDKSRQGARRLCVRSVTEFRIIQRDTLMRFAMVGLGGEACSMMVLGTK